MCVDASIDLSSFNNLTQFHKFRDVNKLLVSSL